jgi:hypothetical protein
LPGTLVAVTASSRQGRRGQGKQGRLHWRDEAAPQRDMIALTIATAGLTNVVVVGAGLDASKQERARRQCLARLLWELESAGLAS